MWPKLKAITITVITNFNINTNINIISKYWFPKG